MTIATEKWLRDRGFRPEPVPGPFAGFYRLRTPNRFGLYATIFAKPGEKQAEVHKRAKAASLYLRKYP